MVETALLIKNEMSQRGREGVDWLVEGSSKREVNNSRWKAVDRSVKISFKNEMSQRGWEAGYWLIEVISESEMCECGWKGVDYLVEMLTKCEMGECRWKCAAGEDVWSSNREERVDWLIEMGAEGEMSE